MLFVAERGPKGGGRSRKVPFKPALNVGQKAVGRQEERGWWLSRAGGGDVPPGTGEAEKPPRAQVWVWGENGRASWPEWEG